MGLEALPAQWHLLSGSSPNPISRPSPFLVDTIADGQRSSLTRRRSSDFNSRASSYLRNHASFRASADGEDPLPRAPSRPWSCENCPGGGPPSSALIRTESLQFGKEFLEHGFSSGLSRWNSEVLQRGIRFDEGVPGDRWRRPDFVSYDASDQSYQGFEPLAVDVALQESGKVGWLGLESARYEPQGMGDREPDTSTEGSELSSVVVITAPSFVKDRQYMDRVVHHPREVAAAFDRVDSGFVDQHLDRVSSISRPASLKRKKAKVCTPGGCDSTSRAITADSFGAESNCTSIPDSLRNLRNRNSGRVAGRREGACSIKKAFNSMIDMIRALQSYTIQLRQSLGSDVNVQHLLSMVHREMHSSFVWLFQQVFSCTPTLMVSVMILLVNFTVYSLGNNVAMGTVMAPDPTSEVVSTLLTQVESGGSAKATSRWSGSSFGRADRSVDPSPISCDSIGHGFGNNGPGGFDGGSVVVAGGEEDDSFYSVGGSRSRAMFSEKDFGPGGRGALDVPRDTCSALFSPKLTGMSDNKSSTGAWTGSEQAVVGNELREQSLSYRVFLEQTVRELDLKKGEPYHHVQLDQETLRILVAPVVTKLESDDYPCFDRTDLEYQDALRAEPYNPMLLANYAQFLYAVRHDNVRAEAFFHRALGVDREDGDTLGRWASFLWLALKDRPRADKAYRDAIFMDPSNPYHAGCYAHFLWHAEDDEDCYFRASPS